MRGLILALALLAGCASAQRDTMLAEVSLAGSLSIAYRTVDGADKVATDRIAAELQTDKDKAKADYAAYKPKIEKARNALNVAEDALEHAEEARQAIAKGSPLSNFTQWLPTLVEAAAQLQQTIADVKELIK